MNYIGIDIGSTSAKTVVMNEEKEIIFKSVIPTGWSSVDTAEYIKSQLMEKGITKENSKIVATGYGRVSVPYADKTYT
ncbi:MAG: BadF/BadG/BcrA/BcrD ATPase family protein, partial [Clostridium sp.]